MSSKASYRSLSRRGALLGLVGLAGCGLTPVYGPNGTATALRGAIAFSESETVMEYQVRARLIERLGDTVQAQYTLRVTLTETPTPATITPDGDTTRFNIFGTAVWTLTDMAGALAKGGEVETFTSYSATGSTVATQTARTDASARLSIALADLIVSRLILAAPELSR